MNFNEAYHPKVKEYGKPFSHLKEIYHLPKSGLRLYLNQNAELFWNLGQNVPKPLATMPAKMQIPFFLKFIQNHDLADRIKFIADPLVCIEMYIKAKFILDADLNIG